MDSLKKRSRRSSRQIFEETVITAFQFDEKKMDSICPRNSTSTKTRNVETTIPRHITDYSKTMEKEKILRPSNPSSP